MDNKSLQPVQNTYDPRWFVWTIVFLLATGVSLVSYIVITSQNTDVEGGVTTHKTVKSEKVQPPVEPPLK